MPFLTIFSRLVPQETGLHIRMAAQRRPGLVASRAPVPPRSTTLRDRLSWLVAGCLLPLVILLTGIVYLGYLQKRTLASRQVEDAASAAAAATERELQSVIINLEVLAASPTIAAGDYLQARHEGEALLRRHYPGGGLALFTPEGYQLYNTFRPIGAKLPRRPDRTGLDAVVATGEPVVADANMAAVLRAPVVPVEVPVFDRARRVTAVLSMATAPAIFLDVIERQHLPRDWIVTVLDRRGAIVARSSENARFFGHAAPAWLREVVWSAPSGVAERRSTEGQPTLVGWRNTGERGWRVAVCVPRSRLFAPLSHTLLQTLLLAALALLGALAVAHRVSRGIAAPITALVALANEQSVTTSQPLALGLREADAVALTLVAARHQRAAAEVRLREEQARNRAELEQLVESRTAELQAAEIALQHARRMEALGQLAGGIAHDVNNVLQTIQGGGALISGKPGDAGLAIRYSGLILEAVERGAAVTRRLLAFSRQADLRAEPISPRDLLTGLREMLTHTLGSGLEIEVAADCGSTLVLADKSQLETVLINLAVNARDATPGAGRLTLSATPLQLAAERMSDQPRLLRQGSYVRLSVQDYGVGMDEATLARASEPFFTTKPAGQGTGLGLAMARGFAEQSGGCLQIESRLAQGTTISLWLQQAPAPDSRRPPEADAHAAGSRPAARLRLLMVDDNLLILQSMAEQLGDLGHVVVCAGSGRAALALLDAGEAIDMIISDLSMPEMDGISFIRAAQLRRPSMPAILLTGFATPAAELAIGSAATGTFTLLRKPIGAAVLADRIGHVMEGASHPMAETAVS